MKSKERKKYQRKINKAVREVNESIRLDDLWKSRFFIRQVESPQWYRYEDGSGGELFVCLRFYDKATKKYKDVFGNSYEWASGNGWYLFWEMNRFIVEDCKVWDENPCPTLEPLDYTNIDCDRITKESKPIYSRPFSIRY